MKIYEPVLLVKLGLSEKFPRRMLHARKLALDVEIIKPSTIIAILAIKFYLGHKRSKDRIAQIIEINEENAYLYYRYNEYPIITQRKFKLEIGIWSDDVGEIL